MAKAKLIYFIEYEQRYLALMIQREWTKIHTKQERKITHQTSTLKYS